MRAWGRIRVAVALLVAAAAGAGCAPGADRTAGGEVLRVVGPYEFHSLTPSLSEGLFTRLEVTETLVSSDLSGELEPGLARSWRAADGGRSWTFALPSDVTFHDGTPVTAEAVAESMTRAVADEASPLAEADVRDVVADGDAVRFELARPYASLPAALTHYSAAVLAPASWTDDGDVDEVIGTGPFRVAEVEVPARIETVRFDAFRNEPAGVSGVSFQAVGRAESRALLAASGQADVAWGLEPAGRERVEQGDGVDMESSLQPRSILMKLDAEHPLLDDVRVRRALSLALDREAMAEAVLRESDLAADQLFPPSLTDWHDPELAPLGHDPAEASRLLAEAGFRPGPEGVLEREGEPLRLTLTTYPDRQELPPLATAIQASWREVGVDLAVDVASSSQIPAGHEDGSLEIGLLTRHLALVTDPYVTAVDTFADGGSEWGVMNWQDPVVDRALTRLDGDPSDPAAQAARQQLVDVVQKQLPLIPVAWYRLNAAVADRVEGFVVDPLERTWRLSSVELAS